MMKATVSVPYVTAPPPWTVDEHPESFIARDTTRAGACVFLFRRTNRGGARRRSISDEARRMAANFAKLPGPRRPTSSK
ncbi:MAG: hypothetical protein ACLQAT_03560 [Candidatus Binataceae bacterium]